MRKSSLLAGLMVFLFVIACASTDDDGPRMGGRGRMGGGGGGRGMRLQRQDGEGLELLPPSNWWREEALPWLVCHPARSSSNTGGRVAIF